MAVYYNENDKFAVQWLRRLIKAGMLPAGEVDDRSIREVQPADLVGFSQCHFFAGIGGWPYALRLAGVSDDQPVWTGSCPCQPFSDAGQRRGEADDRHLWPEFKRLIAQRRPPVLFGEQVASKDGREWLARVRADLEALGYEVGAADLCAAGIGAPHIRQRLYFGAGRMGDADDRGPQGRGVDARERADQQSAGAAGVAGGLADADQGQRGWLADGERRQPDRQASGRVEGDSQPEPSSTDGFWSRAGWLRCTDGKARRVEPGIFPLAHGVSARVGKLRGAGNAIVPQLAAEFIQAFLEAR